MKAQDKVGAMDTRQAAEYVGMSPSTLNVYRTTGRGPKSHKDEFGVFYLKADLDEWKLVTQRGRGRPRNGKASGSAE